MTDAPMRTVVREFDCATDDDGGTICMVELDCRHAEPKVHEGGVDPGNERPCWTCWHEHRVKVLAELRARRRSR